MSLLNNIRLANRLSLTNGINWDAILTTPSAVEYSIKIFSPDIGLVINPNTGLAFAGTGLAFAGRRISATFRLDNILIADVAGSKIKFTSFESEIEGIVKNPMYDRSLGNVTVSIRILEAI